MKLKPITESQWDNAVTSRTYSGKYEELRNWVKNTENGQIEVEAENKKELTRSVVAAQVAARKSNKTLKVKNLSDTKAYLCVLPV